MRHLLFRNQSRFVLGKARHRRHMELAMTPNNELQGTALRAAAEGVRYPTTGMQYVSSLGGPRVMLPTSDVGRWNDELGESPTPDDGLYRIACSIDRYCGVISPWDTPLLIFGDDPSDIYFLPEQHDGLFFRWIGADSIEQLAAFAIDTANGDSWDEMTPFTIVDPHMTLMDACAFADDSVPRIHMKLRIGSYTIRSRYAETPDVIAVVHRLEYVG
jgi:hypothetical protein